MSKNYQKKIKDYKLVHDLQNKLNKTEQSIFEIQQLYKDKIFENEILQDLQNKQKQQVVLQDENLKVKAFDLYDLKQKTKDQNEQLKKNLNYQSQHITPNNQLQDIMVTDLKQVELLKVENDLKQILLQKSNKNLLQNVMKDKFQVEPFQRTYIKTFEDKQKEKAKVGLDRKSRKQPSHDLNNHINLRKECYKLDDKINQLNHELSMNKVLIDDLQNENKYLIENISQKIVDEVKQQFQIAQQPDHEKELQNAIKKVDFLEIEIRNQKIIELNLQKDKLQKLNDQCQKKNSLLQRPQEGSNLYIHPEDLEKDPYLKALKTNEYLKQMIQMEQFDSQNIKKKVIQKDINIQNEVVSQKLESQSIDSKPIISSNNLIQSSENKKDMYIKNLEIELERHVKQLAELQAQKPHEFLTQKKDPTIQNLIFQLKQDNDYYTQKIAKIQLQYQFNLRKLEKRDQFLQFCKDSQNTKEANLQNELDNQFKVKFQMQQERIKIQEKVSQANKKFEQLYQENQDLKRQFHPYQLFPKNLKLNQIHQTLQEKIDSWTIKFKEENGHGLFYF